MIAETGTAKLCKDCKHAMNEGGQRYVCTRLQNVVTGHSVDCADARAGHCGLDGTMFERRMNVAAYVDQATISMYVKDDGSVHVGSVHAKPIAENDKLKAFLPRDVNLDEWKRD